jgi:hypothetical protein
MVIVMRQQSFGDNRKPYHADFEIADDLVPDPFSEEPEPHTAPHKTRASKPLKKQDNKQNH